MVLFAGEGLAEKLWVEAHPGAVRDVLEHLRHSPVHLALFPLLGRLQYHLPKVLVVSKLTHEEVKEVKGHVLVLLHAAHARLHVGERLL
jgi:hypothetical protein